MTGVRCRIAAKGSGAGRAALPRDPSPDQGSGRPGPRSTSCAAEGRRLSCPEADSILEGRPGDSNRRDATVEARTEARQGERRWGFIGAGKMATVLVRGM